MVDIRRSNKKQFAAAAAATIKAKTLRMKRRVFDCVRILKNRDLTGTTQSSSFSKDVLESRGVGPFDVNNGGGGKRKYVRRLT